MRKLFIALLLPAVLLADPPDIATTPHLSPAQEKAAFTVPEGFEVQLVAAEPDIHKPLNMAFDAGPALGHRDRRVPVPPPTNDTGPRHRQDPLGLRPRRPGAQDHDLRRRAEHPHRRACRIKTARSSTASPTSVDAAATRRQRQGDKREVLYTGFGHHDTHGMTNAVHLGLRRLGLRLPRLFATTRQVKGTDGHADHDELGQHLPHSSPTARTLEQFTRGQVNPFGLCFDPLGNLYSARLPQPSRSTQLLRGGVLPELRQAARRPRLRPRDGLTTTTARRPSAASPTTPPTSSRRNTASTVFIGDVVTNRINQFDGPGMARLRPRATRKPDFLTATTRGSARCDIKLGPDGALYVADFYNRIIGHYEVPLNHPGRDRERGRIWRIVRKDKPLPTIPDRTKSTPGELVKDLDSPNITARFLAMNQLVARGRMVAPGRCRNAL